MARRVVLHIGTMKSGTSFIQNVLAENREVLREQGVLFPGRHWRNQVKAVLDLIEHGGKGEPPLADDGPWRALAREVNEWDGTAVISMEFLGPRRLPKIRVIQRSFPGARLDVVMTARDLARSIPAMWQESVQNAGHATWPDFLAAIRSAEPDAPAPARWFWRQQGLAEMAERWAGAVGRDHFVLVTVPPRGAPPSVLWGRFAEVAGIAADSCRLDVRANPSIGAASALVMRALNERLAADPLPRQKYQRFVKHALAKRGLAHRGKEPSLGIDEPWVLERGRKEVEALRGLGLRVVGDLDELLPEPVKGVHTDEVGVEEQLEAALDGLALVVRKWALGKGPLDD